MVAGAGPPYLVINCFAAKVKLATSAWTATTVHNVDLLPFPRFTGYKQDHETFQRVQVDSL